MKRYIRSATESYQLYRNKRNENKYIEVKKSSDGHTWYRQFMFWNTDRGPVKNYSGAKDNKRGRYHRGTQESLKKILEDYVPVEFVEDGVKDDFSYRGSPENPNDVISKIIFAKGQGKIVASCIGNYRGYEVCQENDHDQRFYFLDDKKNLHFADLEEELKSKIDKFIEQKGKPVEATIAWTGEPDAYYNQRINQLADQRMEARIKSWRDVYNEFVKIADKYFPDDDKIDQEVNKLYFKHSKNPYFQEAWKRWGDSGADPEELEYMYDEVESAVKTKVKPFVVTYMYDDGDAENGPHPYGGEDLVYAEDEEEACQQWEEYCDADRLEGYAGCTARLATPDDVDRLENEKKEYGIMNPVLDF